MSTMRLDAGPAALLWLLFSLGEAQSLLAQPVTGPFSQEQAQRGAKSYAGACAQCHGTDLVGGVAPPLAGVAFLGKWGAMPINALWMAVRQMPPAAAGTLSSDTYLDLTAFLLERTGHAPGSALKVDSKALLELKVAPSPATTPRVTPPQEFIKGTGTPVPEGAGPTQNELNAADTSKKDWLYHTHGYSGTRYAASTEITPQNAGRLRAACAFQLGEQSNFQTGPLVYNGRMYVTGVRSTAAIDARDCNLLWKHEWTPKEKESWLNNRGAAIKDGYLIRGTSDGYLLALNMSSGEFIWARRVADSSIGEAFVMAPLIFEDRILIGPGGSENGISGWVGAFRLTDGQPDPLPGLEHPAGGAAHQRVHVHQRQRLVGRDQHSLAAAHDEQGRSKCESGVAVVDMPGHGGHGYGSNPERDCSGHD